jgi:hypothetical protein
VIEDSQSEENSDVSALIIFKMRVNKARVNSPIERERWQMSTAAVSVESVGTFGPGAKNA